MFKMYLYSAARALVVGLVHNLSARAAALGHILESISLSSTYSVHIHV